MSQAISHDATQRRRFAAFRRADDQWLLALCARYGVQQAALTEAFDRYSPLDPPETLRCSMIDALSDIRDQVAEVRATTRPGMRAKARLLLSDIAEFGDDVTAGLAASLARDILQS